VTPFGTLQVGDDVTAVYNLTNLAPTPTALPTTFSVLGTGLSVASHTCPTSLASGASCQVTLRFLAPLTATTITGTVNAITGYPALINQQRAIGHRPQWHPGHPEPELAGRLLPM